MKEIDIENKSEVGRFKKLTRSNWDQEYFMRDKALLREEHKCPKCKKFFITLWEIKNCDDHD